MKYFVHPNGLCETTRVGDGTKIWAFAHVLPGAQLGKNCNICDHVFIENDVVLGDRVTVKCGVQLWDGLRIADDVFIGPNVTFTNDPFPRSKDYKKPLKTRIERGASIGANATILPGLTIGAIAMIGAGSVVTHNVPSRAIVMGNPAIITGYVGTSRFVNKNKSLTVSDKKSTPAGVGDAILYDLPVYNDLRGNLAVGEFNSEIPFTPARYFVVHDVPSKEVRGEHAHRACKQFLTCLHGSIAVVLDDGQNRTEIVLDRPSLGLYVPPMVWSVNYRYSKDAILLVYASDSYDQSDYIRDYDTFLTLKNSKK